MSSIAEATDADLTPLAVMQANMEFFHRKAGELMAVIMSLPTLTRDEATDAQVQALKDMAGLLKMREMAEMCARDLCRYTHPPLAPKPYTEAPQAGNRHPGSGKRGYWAHPHAQGGQSTPSPRIAAGLPPEPRKRL